LESREFAVQEILILGRGGQGAQTAGNQLARAFFAEGKFVQTFATYGGARRGTPVSASLRVADRPIRLRSNISRADALLCFDESLLDQAFLGLAAENAVVLVNSAMPAADFQDMVHGMGRARIVPLDGRGIAQRNDMGKVVNSALIGGLAAALNTPTLEGLCEVIRQTAPARINENIAACREAHAAIRAGLVEDAA